MRRSSYLLVLSVGTLLISFCSSTPDQNPKWPGCDFGPAQSLGPTVNSTHFDGSPTVSADEKTLFFTSGRNGQQDLFVSTRLDKVTMWSDPVNLGNAVNDFVGDDFSLRLSTDGKTLYFASNRPGGFGAADIYVATRESTNEAWSQAINIGPSLNTAAFEAFPTPSADGNTLYFNRSTTFDSENSDIWVTSRADSQTPWATPQRLAAPVNGPRAEFSPSISADGLSIFFASDRDGNFGSIDIWVSQRNRVADSWGTPRNLGSNINAPNALTLAPFITADNGALYFMSARPAGGARCTPVTCIDALDLYVAHATCTTPSRE